MKGVQSKQMASIVTCQDRTGQGRGGRLPVPNKRGRVPNCRASEKQILKLRGDIDQEQG